MSHRHVAGGPSPGVPVFPSPARVVPPHPASPSGPRRSRRRSRPDRSTLRGTTSAAVALAAILVAGGPAAPASRAATVGPRVVTTVVSDGPVTGGSQATFRIAVQNAGSAPATAPVVLKLSSAGAAALTAPQAAGSGWDCTPADGALTCTDDDELPAGGSLPPLVYAATTPLHTPAASEAELSVSTATTGTGSAGTATATAAILATSPADVVLSMTAPAPTASAADRAYDVRVRNVSDTATAEPVTVAFSTASGAVRASGLGWTCDPVLDRCVYALPLLGGAEAQPLRALTDAGTTPSLTATVSGGGDRDPERGNDTATAKAVLVPSSPAADLNVTIPELHPVVRGDPVDVPLRVGNSGLEDAPGPITVAVQPYTPATFVSGPGWACTARSLLKGLRCTHDGPVPAGGALADLHVGYDATPVFGSSGPAVTATVIAPSAVDADTTNDSVTSTATVGSGPVALTPSFDAVSPEIGGHPGSAELVVRNEGSRASSGKVVVHTDGWTGVDGNGWRCLDSCVYGDPIAPGTAAPPLQVVIGSDGDLQATVSGGGDVDAANAHAATLVPGAPARSGRYLDVSGYVSADGPGSSGDISGTISSGGSVPITGPVDLRIDPGPGVVVQDVSGPGLRCTGLRCRFDDGLPTGAARTFLARLRVTGRIGGPSAVRLRATAPADPDVTPDDVAPPYVPVGTGGDLVVGVDDADPVAPGDAAEFRVVARNVGGAPVKGPILATVPAPPFGSPDIASGDGWLCEPGGGTCIHDGPVAAGAALPPLVVRPTIPTFSSADTSSPFEADVRALSDDDTGGDNDSALAHVPVSSADGPNITVAIAAVDPAPFAGGVRFAARVRNTGTRPTSSPVEVSFAESLNPAGTATAAGTSWACPQGDDHCVLRGGLDPGQQAPPLILTGPATTFFAGRPETGDVRASATEGTDADDAAHAEITRVPGPTVTGPDAAMTLTGGDPLAPGESTVLHATVRGAGTTDPTGGTTVQLTVPKGRASASGDGWDCDPALRCTTTVNATAGSVLPPVDLRLRAPATDPTGPLTVTAVATVAGDTTRGDDTATATVGAGEGGADLVVLAATEVPPRAGMDAVSLLRVHNAGSRTSTGPTVVTVSGGPAASVSGSGWTCDGGRCTTDAPIAANHDAPTLRVVRSFPADAQPNGDTVTATVSGDDDQTTDDVSRSITGVGVGTRSVVGRSTRIGVDALPEQAYPGDVVPVQVAIRGADGEAGGPGTVSVDLPDDLTYVLPDPGEAAPTVSGHRLTWDVDVPADRTPVAIRFSVIVGPTAAPGPRTLSATLHTAGTADEPDASSLLVVPRTPPADAGGGGGGGTTSQTPGTGGTNPGLAALLAALANGSHGATPGKASATPARPSVRLSTPRPPRIGVLARSGWLVSSRITTVTGLRAELTADAATAHRLHLRTGTVLARAASGRHAAGTVRLRLRVPAALRAKVRRATRLSGTLRVRTTSAAGPASASRKVALRR